MSDDASTEDEVVDENAQLSQSCVKRILFSGVLTLVMLLTLIILLVCLVFASKALNEQKGDTSTYRLDELSNTINQNFDTIKSEHEENKEYLKEYLVLPLPQRHAAFFNSVISGEDDTEELVTAYQAYMYDIASRVRGSGEWHSFFTGKLDYLEQRSNNRNRYLEALAPEAESEPDLL